MVKKSEVIEKKVVAIYCRVSTHEQGKGDFSSLKSQEDLLRHYCLAKGWTVYNVYTDTKTGSNLERTGIAQLRRDAEEGKFNVVAVTKFDRLSRSMKDFQELNQLFKNLDIALVVSTQSIDTTTAPGKMLQNILVAFAEFERDIIADRTREKLYSQAQKGIWNGGFLQLGYNQKGNELTVNEKEADLVRLIFNYYIQEPSSYKVADRLNKEGYRTKIRKTKKGSLSGGGLFDGAHVSRILRSKFFIGKITFKNEEFQGLHPAIIDEETFFAVQRLMDQNKTNAKSTYNESDLLLLGITKCGYCGSYLTSTFGNSKQGERYYYYKCTKKMKHGSNNCEGGDLPAEKFENFVEKIIVHIGQDKEFFNAVFKQMTVNENHELKELKEKLVQLKTNLKEINRQISNVTDVLAISGMESFKTIEDKLNSLTGEKGLTEEQIQRIERDIEVISKYDVPQETLQKRYADLANIYAKLPLEKKRNLAKAMILGIESFMKKKENKGMVRFSFRGDGIVEMAWDKTQKAEVQISNFGLPWLRG